MAKARYFDVTLKDQPDAPRTYRKGGYTLTRGKTIQISNVADADFFDASPEFQVIEVSEAKAAEASAKPAAPKGRFSRTAPPAPAAEEAEEESDDDGEDDESPADEAPAASDEGLEAVLAPKKKPAKGKAAKKSEQG